MKNKLHRLSETNRDWSHLGSAPERKEAAIIA